MDMLTLLATARDGALHPDDPIELTARLADTALGAAIEERRALIEVLTAGYPGALAVGDQARAERIAETLRGAPHTPEALAAWRALIGDAAAAGGTRWRAGASLAARSEVLLLVAAIRSETAVETLAVTLCRDGREISSWIDTPSAAYAALLTRLSAEGAAVVGYDLPRLLSLLPAELAAIFDRPAAADLTLTAEWLAERGALDAAGFGLDELALAAAVPGSLATIGGRIDAVAAVWFRLLRPRLLS